MLNFELYIPTKLYFGRGQCGRVGEIAAGRGFRRALICYGGGSAGRSGPLVSLPVAAIVSTTPTGRLSVGSARCSV